MMQRLLRKLAEVENKGRFTDVLGLTLGRAPPVGVVAADEVEVRDFVVPARLVLPSSGELGLGAVVALFDEVSTFGIMERDRTHRWGVSVSLSATRHGDEPLPSAGEKVRISSRTVRLGRTLGFCDCALESEDGALLASGRHTKYLPTGIPLWDVLMAPPFRPLFLRYLDWAAASKPSPPPVDEVLEAMRHVDDAVRVGEGGAFVPDAMVGNMAGNAHGGALSIAASRFAAAGRGAAAQQPRSMHCEFLSAVAPGAPLSVAATATAATATRVEITRGATRVFQAQVAWDR